jgi:cytochrome c oxidase subunit II
MTSLLIFLIVILAIVTVAQMARVYELSSELRGKREEDISLRDTKFNASLMLVFLAGFFAFVTYYIVAYWDKWLPPSASEHGNATDWLLNFNFLIILSVFVITHIFLFYFAYKYQYRVGQQASYFTHSNKLEVIWTVIPALVLSVIIILGIKTWSSVMMTDPAEGAITIELYSKQFDWTARYAGKDNMLGNSDYRLIQGANFLGLDSTDKNGSDDIIVKGEFHIPVNKPVKFLMRSQDVIHSAYMPHFRSQINTVPGMTTTFHFVPTITTEEMRKNPNVVKQYEEINAKRRAQGKEEAQFNYVLICNKICGASHYNMQMDIIVESEEDYNKWLASQPVFNAGNMSEKASEDKVKIAETVN